MERRPAGKKPARRRPAGEDSEGVSIWTWRRYHTSLADQEEEWTLMKDPCPSVDMANSSGTRGNVAGSRTCDVSIQAPILTFRWLWSLQFALMYKDVMSVWLGVSSCNRQWQQGQKPTRRYMMSTERKKSSKADYKKTTLRCF